MLRDEKDLRVLSTRRTWKTHFYLEPDIPGQEVQAVRKTGRWQWAAYIVEQGRGLLSSQANSSMVHLKEAAGETGILFSRQKRCL